MKTVVKTLAVLAILAVVAVPVVVYSGLFNVAATWEDPAPVAWALHSTYANSVAARADNIQVPQDLGNQSQVLRGARSYMAMCSGCHTPPGQSATPVSQGLNPPPPDLPEIIPHRTPAEAFWVIKNGVRMTGMPAFGPTHKDDELWALVAFLKQMSGATAKEYNTLIAQAKRNAPVDDGHRHRHGNEPPASGDARGADPENGHGEPGHHGTENATQPASTPSHASEEAQHGPPEHPEGNAQTPPPAEDGHDHQS